MKRKTMKIGAAALSLAMVVSIFPEVPSSIVHAETPGTYSYINDYTLGYAGGVVVYTGGKTSTSVSASGIKTYGYVNDNPFESQVDQAWDVKDLKLSQPVKYTTSDGEVHNVESMLTNFDFIADPTAIDNSEIDGKLYVYGTTEGIEYSKGITTSEDKKRTYQDGQMMGNGYNNHSLTILSTTDMVNWTDEGFMDSLNLTNERSDSDQMVANKFTSGKSWAPSGLKIDGDGDGKNEYYLFYTNSGSTGYVMSDSPTGPWVSPHDGALFEKSTPNCSDCSVCFDPAVLADDKGNAYVYFGGLSRTSGRGCKILFEPGTGYVERDGDPVKLPTYAMFEDNEINQFNGKYYYSYCSDFNSQTLTKTASICVYVSSDPLNITFDPTTRTKGEEMTAFTGDDGVYHHFLGTVLDNPSVLYGQSYNNHHHMQSFKGHNYIFYHSTELNNALHRVSESYRNLHVDEINVDAETDNISVTPSYEGAEQIEGFNPYKDFAGNKKYINATTTSYSAGVKSTRDDDRVDETNNGSSMVLDCINTGDWTKLQGVDFGDNGAKKFTATLASATADGAVEVFLDDPTVPTNMVASLPLENTDMSYKDISVDLSAADVNGTHDVYFIFRGDDFKVASWKFNENVADPTASPAVQTPTTAPTAKPTVTAVPTATVAPTAVASTAPTATVEKLKVSKITAKKNANKVVVKTNKGATVQIKVYKSLKLAKKAGKSGLVKSYIIKASKNKSGSISIRLKKKLRVNQAVLVTVKKAGRKTVKVVKKVK